MKPKAILRRFFAIAGSSLMAISSSYAADVSWDSVIGGGVITGGSGTWDTTNTYWTTDSGVTNQLWVNSNNDTAVFGGTAGTVALGGPITVGGLKFNSNYTVNGSGANVLSFGVPGDIFTNTGVSATISSTLLSGSATVTKTGAGQLTINGNIAYAGQFTLNEGTLTLQPGTSPITPFASLSLNGGIFEYKHFSVSTAMNVTVGGDATIRINRNGTSSSQVVTYTFGALSIGSNTLSIDKATGGASSTTFSSTTLTGNAIFDIKAAFGGDGVTGDLNLGNLSDGGSGRTITKNGPGGNLTWGTITLSGNHIWNVNTGSITSGAIGTAGFSLTKGGAGTLNLTGALTGAGNVMLNGGTLNFGTALTHTAGTLTLSASSTIGMGTSSTSFASSVADWDTPNVNLSLTGTLGPATTSLRFGTDSNGLSAAQLARITYTLASGVAKPVTLDASGYIRSTSYDGSWTGSSGNWSDTTKWSNAIFADGEDATATGAGHTSGLKTITLNSNRTIGYLSLHASSSNNFQINGTDILTLATSSGIPRIRNTSRFGFSNINVTLAGNDGLEIGDTSLGIENGSIKLTGDNNYTGGTKLTASTLLVGHVNALSTGVITFNGGGLASSDATAYTFANTIALTGNVIIGQWHSNNPGVGTGNMSFTDTATTALGSSRTFTVATGITATFAQSFTGTSNTITKAGAGTLVLTGNNSGVTGGATLIGGTLILSGSTALPAGTLTWGTTNTILQLENESNLAITNTLATSGRSLNRTLVFDRLTSGAAVNLSFSSQPNLDCGTVFNFQAGSDITSGTPTITFSGGTTSSDSNNGTIAGGTGASGAIRFNPTGVNVVINGIGSSGRTRGYILDGTSTGNRITGTWSNGSGTEVHKNGTGTWTLAGVSQYTLKTTINNGTLQFEKQTALYNNTAASWTAANLNVKSGGTLAFNVGGTGEFTTGNVTTLLTNLADSSSATSGMNAGSNFGFDTTNASGGTFTIADVIADTTGASGGARGLIKLGTNTLVLSNLANTYTGATTVSAGTLLVTGSLVSDVSVSNGATLGGGGTVDDLSLAGGSLFDMFMAVGSLDSLAATNISFASTGFGIDNLVYNGSAVNWALIDDGIYTLITGTLNSNNLDNYGLVNAQNIGDSRIAYFQEGSLQLVVQAIPEPKTAILGVISVLLLLRRRR
jgi:autotransporter-associated beta strand protein